MGEGWTRRGGLITSFNIYISHVQNFTSKIKKIMMGVRSPENYFWFIFLFSLFMGIFDKRSIIHYYHRFLHRSLWGPQEGNQNHGGFPQGR